MDPSEETISARKKKFRKKMKVYDDIDEENTDKMMKALNDMMKFQNIKRKSPNDSINSRRDYDTSTEPSERMTDTSEDDSPNEIPSDDTASQHSVMIEKDATDSDGSKSDSDTVLSSSSSELSDAPVVRFDPDDVSDDSRHDPSPLIEENHMHHSSKSDTKEHLNSAKESIPVAHDASFSEAKNPPAKEKFFTHKAKRPPSGRRAHKSKSHTSKKKYGDLLVLSDDDIGNILSTNNSLQIKQDRPLSGDIFTKSTQKNVQMDDKPENQQHSVGSRQNNDSHSKSDESAINTSLLSEKIRHSSRRKEAQHVTDNNTPEQGKTLSGISRPRPVSGRPPSGNKNTKDNLTTENERPSSGKKRPQSGKERPSSAVNRKSIPSRKDSLLSLHGGSSHEDEVLYGKAEDDELERIYMTPTRNNRPNVEIDAGETLVELETVSRTSLVSLVDEAASIETKPHYEKKSGELPPVRMPSSSSLKLEHRISSGLTAEVLPPIGHMSNQNEEGHPRLVATSAASHQTYEKSNVLPSPERFVSATTSYPVCSTLATRSNSEHSMLATRSNPGPLVTRSSPEHSGLAKKTSLSHSTSATRPNPNSYTLAKKSSPEHSTLATISTPNNNTLAKRSSPEQSTLAKRSSPEQSTLAKRSSPEQSTLAKRSSPEQSTLAKRSSPEQSTLAKRSSPEHSTLATRSSPEQSTLAKRSSPEQSTLDKRTSPEQPTLAKRTSPEQSTLAKGTSPEHSTLPTRSSPEQSTLAKRSSPEQSTFAKRTNPEHSTLATRSSPEQSTLAKRSSPEHSTLATRSSPEQSTLAKRSSPEQSTLAKRSSPEHSTHVTRSSPEQSTLAKRSSSEQSTLAKRSSPEHSTLATRSSPEQSTLARRSSPEQSTLAKRSSSEQSTFAKRSSSEQSTLGTRSIPVHSMLATKSHPKNDTIATKLNPDRSTFATESIEIGSTLPVQNRKILMTSEETSKLSDSAPENNRKSPIEAHSPSISPERRALSNEARVASSSFIGTPTQIDSTPIETGTTLIETTGEIRAISTEACSSSIPTNARVPSSDSHLTSTKFGETSEQHRSTSTVRETLGEHQIFSTRSRPSSTSKNTHSPPYNSRGASTAAHGENHSTLESPLNAKETMETPSLPITTLLETEETQATSIKPSSLPISTNNRPESSDSPIILSTSDRTSANRRAKETHPTDITIRPTSNSYGPSDYTSIVTYEKKKKTEEDIGLNGLPPDEYSEGSDDELKRVMTRIDNVYDPLGSIQELEKNDKDVLPSPTASQSKKRDSGETFPSTEPVENTEPEIYDKNISGSKISLASREDSPKDLEFFETSVLEHIEVDKAVSTPRELVNDEDKPNVLSSVATLDRNIISESGYEHGIENNGYTNDEIVTNALLGTEDVTADIDPEVENIQDGINPNDDVKTAKDNYRAEIGEGSCFTGSPFSRISEVEEPYIELPRKPKWHPPWQLKQEIVAHSDTIPVLIIDPTNRWFATGSSDKTIKMWDINNGRQKLAIKAHKQAVRAMTFGIAGHRHLYSSADDRQLYCHDVEINRITSKFKGQAAVIYSMCIYPPSHLLITGGRDKLVKLYDTRTTKCVKTLRGHQNTASCVVAVEQTRQIVSGSHDGTLRVWDIGEGRCINVLQGHNKSVRAVALHPDGSTILSASSERILSWELPTGDMVQEIQAENIAINSVTINHHGVTVAGGSNGVIHLWDYKSGHRFQKINRSKVYDSQEVPICVFATKFDHTGTKLICSDACNVVKIYREAYTRMARRYVSNAYGNLTTRTSTDVSIAAPGFSHHPSKSSFNPVKDRL